MPRTQPCVKAAGCWAAGFIPEDRLCRRDFAGAAIGVGRRHLRPARLLPSADAAATSNREAGGKGTLNLGINAHRAATRCVAAARQRHAKQTDRSRTGPVGRHHQGSPAGNFRTLNVNNAPEAVGCATTFWPAPANSCRCPFGWRLRWLERQMAGAFTNRLDAPAFFHAKFAPRPVRPHGHDPDAEKACCRLVTNACFVIWDQRALGTPACL